MTYADRAVQIHLGDMAPLAHRDPLPSRRPPLKGGDALVIENYYRPLYLYLQPVT